MVRHASKLKAGKLTSEEKGMVGEGVDHQPFEYHPLRQAQSQPLMNCIGPTRPQLIPQTLQQSTHATYLLNQTAS